MSETIFLLDEAGNLSELREASYLSEELLQQLLADYPNLISGSQINQQSPRRWLLISREYGVPDEESAADRWSLDHLFIDQEGIPTLVEVKRSTDTRIRREVVGQMLDYAANAVTYWSIEEIKHRFEERCRIAGKDAPGVLAEFLENELEEERFWELTKTNLRAGRIRMLIIADRIPKELQRIIEFLNEQMSPAEFLGLEIKQFVGKNTLKTLVPRVIGQTAVADHVKGTVVARGETWTEERFLKEIGLKQGNEDLTLAQKLLAQTKSRMSRVWYGSGKKIGSVTPCFDRSGYSYYPFAVWTNGWIEIQFQHFRNQPPFDSEPKRRELLERLNQISGVSIPENKLSARPSISLKALADNHAFETFMSIVDWFVSEVENRHATDLTVGSKSLS